MSYKPYGPYQPANDPTTQPQGVTPTPRAVKLMGGPHDGLFSVASHDTAFFGQECYVYGGSEDRNQFVHVDTVLRALPMAQREEERNRVQQWMDRPHAPLGELLGIPPWRIHAWYVAIVNEIPTNL